MDWFGDWLCGDSLVERFVETRYLASKILIPDTYYLLPITYYLLPITSITSYLITVHSPSAP
jgi:hypothetical protein